MSLELKGIFLILFGLFCFVLTASAYLLVSLVPNNHFRQGFRLVQLSLSVDALDKRKSHSMDGAVASWLLRSSPGRLVWVRVLAGDIVLCSWAFIHPGPGCSKAD